jgi:hypothetical protein
MLRNFHTSRWSVSGVALLMAWVAVFAVGGKAFAQTADDLTEADYAEMGEAGPIVREIRPIKDKVVVFIFDISGSMKAENMLRRARKVMAEIVKNGVGRGDEVALLTFGPTYETVRKRIESGADRSEIVDKIPFEPGTDSGTNIRKPHHDALRLIKEAEPRPGIIIVLTDSYNDQPKEDSPAFADYKSYYVPGQLSKHPKTSENSSYENLLQTLVVSGQVKQYGVGVKFAENGRPIERVPQAAPPPVTVPRETEDSSNVTAEPPKQEDWTWLWVTLGALGLIGGYLVLAPLFKPVAFRLRGVGSPKDFSLSGGQSVRIGGEGASFAPDALGIPGVTQTVATIKVAGGKMLLSPGGNTATKTTATVTEATSNEKTAPRVYHNGLALETPIPLVFGDEIKITVPQPGSLPKDYRIKVEDPRENL